MKTFISVKKTVALLDQFFPMEMTDSQRRQFVEDYFPGRDVDERASVPANFVDGSGIDIPEVVNLVFSSAYYRKPGSDR